MSSDLLLGLFDLKEFLRARRVFQKGKQKIYNKTGRENAQIPIRLSTL